MICKVCGKKMPPTVMKAHMAKSHDTEVVERKAREQVEKKTFDYQASEVCASCSQEIPVILMPYHSHVRHGT